MIDNKDKLKMFQRMVDENPDFKRMYESYTQTHYVPPPRRPPAKEPALTLSPQQIEAIAEAIANKVVAKLRAGGAS
jgi:hypothetical protein